MVAVEFVADRKSRRFFDPQTRPHRVIARNGLDEGLLVRALPDGEINSFSPPLCMPRNDVDEVVERYARTVDRAMPELRQHAGQATASAFRDRGMRFGDAILAALTSVIRGLALATKLGLESFSAAELTALRF